MAIYVLAVIVTCYLISQFSARLRTTHTADIAVVSPGKVHGFARLDSILRGLAVEDRAYLALLPWLTVVLCVLFCKLQWLKYGGYAMAASAMNRPYETPASFSRFERLAFFNGDLLFTCLIAPCFLLLIARFLRPAWRVSVTVLVSLVCATIVLTQYSAFSMIGRLASWRILMTGFDWWYEHPDSGSDALVHSFIMRLSLATLLILITGAACFLAVKRPRPLLHKAVGNSFQAFSVICLLLAVSTYRTASHIPVFANDFLTQSTSALFENGSSTLAAGFFQLTPQQQYSAYRGLAHAPAPGQQTPPYFGSAAGYNVLIFIFETTPTRVLDPARDSLDDYPNIRALRERSLVASEHFTTYPATDLATFALFSSMYLSDPIGASVNRDFPGLMHVLDSVGYETGFYGYMWKGNGDDAMLHHLGFSKLVNSDLGSTFFTRLEEGNLGLETRIQRDIGPLHALMNDISTWATQKRKFAAVYFPQMGHGPWPAVPGEPNSTADERARFLARYQDSWIGELVHRLELTGELEHTIFVVTGDHGIRFRSENSELPVGRIDEMSYHVPFLVSIPKVLSHEVRIDWPTSHIDLEPTLLDLLGIEQGRQWEQGTAIWNPQLSSRRVFLLGDRLFGADGYFDGRDAVMLQNQIGTVFESGSLHFERDGLKANDSAEAKAAKKTLKEFASFEAVVNAELRNGRIQ